MNHSEPAADQIVKNLREIWNCVDPTLSLHPNRMRDVSAIEDQFFLERFRKLKSNTLKMGRSNNDLNGWSQNRTVAKAFKQTKNLNRGSGQGKTTCKFQNELNDSEGHEPDIVPDYDIMPTMSFICEITRRNLKKDGQEATSMSQCLTTDLQSFWHYFSAFNPFGLTFHFLGSFCLLLASEPFCFSSSALKLIHKIQTPNRKKEEREMKW